MERFDVQFLGSVEVPCHQGNGILCAAMQKVSVGMVAGNGWRPTWMSPSPSQHSSRDSVASSLEGGDVTGLTLRPNSEAYAERPRAE